MEEDFPGSAYLLKPLIFTTVASGIFSFGLWYHINRKYKAALAAESRVKKLVVITGCDSGLGLAMAYWAGKLGYKILAGCLDAKSEGAEFLKNEFDPGFCHICHVDVTKPESLIKFRKHADAILRKNTELVLHALISNAAVGGFGEFFWQTEDQMRRMMEVNFWGSVNLTKVFESQLIHSTSRLIIVTSDCADYPLPGLSTYSASKAAQQSWALSLRREIGKYGVSVVSFQPGSFPTNSKLFSRQPIFYEEMKSQMNGAELEGFYGEYFHDYNHYFSNIFKVEGVRDVKSSSPINDGLVRRYFMSLLENNVTYKPVVICEEIGVTIFHFLMRRLPVKWADGMITKLLKVPKWIPGNNNAAGENGL